ncbi:TetR/AcrR family transcriptional regulator [Mycolicibacterium fallax]|uniref:TetR family transcriptional regulator n=1 Tax=Mycolicibacterium fallax TaxID=1793 RepID=A0A1X1R2D0_MYCFA|nr:TetR family transcriptional regulator [Mycolicibacterium fallax]ORU98360.1 TetR family transcriptional regulator [Mycolicibacterium fallax]HOW93473.1 TetR family transcriptional regulator [Mycolicibacterium fallax]HSA41191.1 TetR family transcriptional regulator [Mycobacterium sp.]
MRSTSDLSTADRIRDAAIDQFGRHGFGVGVRAIAAAAGVSPGLVNHHFGSKGGLRAACDTHVAEVVREAKSETLQTHDPAAWLTAAAEIEDYAPLTGYLVRSLQSGGELARTLWRRMIDNAEQYLEEGVRAGTIKPTADPRARARFLSMVGGGAFLLYIQLHDDPGDLRRVLHDYTQDMMLPALELYSNGLLTDPGLYQAFLARAEETGGIA